MEIISIPTLKNSPDMNLTQESLIPCEQIVKAFALIVVIHPSAFFILSERNGSDKRSWASRSWLRTISPWPPFSSCTAAAPRPSPRIPQQDVTGNMPLARTHCPRTDSSISKRRPQRLCRNRFPIACTRPR